MLKNKSSKTADLTAAIRARHRKFDQEIIFNDAYAKDLCGFPMRYLCNNPLFNYLLKQPFVPDIKGAESLVLYRANLIERQIYRFVREGGDQYIVIAAGMDSFSLRYDQLNADLKIIEIDHPNTQKEKINRIKKKGIRIPENVEFVPADLANETLESVLQSSSFDPNKKAFFSCAGLTYYLSKEKAMNIFSDIAKNSCDKSEIMFDYSVAAENMTKDQVKKRNKIKGILKKTGEEIKSNFDEQELKSDMLELGLSLVNSYTPDDISEAFFNKPNKDKLRVSPHNCVGHFRKQS